MSCRVEMPNARRLDVTAGTIAMGGGGAESAPSQPDVEEGGSASAPRSNRAREVCISAMIVVGIVATLGVIVAVF
jgi:hypothetical protein